MASPEGSFVEMHQDFVLKLKVVGEGGKCIIWPSAARVENSV